MHFWVKLIFMISLLCLYLKGNGQSLQYLQEGELEYPLGRHVQILTDSSLSLNFEDVRSGNFEKQFKKSDSDKPNPGFNPITYWYRFNVYNVSSDKFNWLLHINFPGIDTIEVYQIHKTGEVERYITGDLFPFSDRPIDYKTFLIPIYPRSGETLQVYVRIAGISTKIWNASIVEESYFFGKSVHLTIFNILTSGILIGLFIYNLFLYFGTKSKNYLYYVFYLFAFWLTSFFIQGYGFQVFFRNQPEIANVTTNTLGIITLLFSSIFSRIVLTLQSINPKLVKGIKACEFLLLIGMIIQLSSYFHKPAYLWGFWSLNIGIFLFFPIFILMGIIGLRNKVSFARFYSIAWGFAIIGAAITSLKNNGVVDSNFLTEYAIQFGVIIQASLFSFGLADRINVAEKERIQAQETTIEALKENERIVKNQNIVLESLVQERTEELNTNLETVSAQKLEIERQNRNILSSITYASRIQKSILPDQNELESLFGTGNAFIYYKPKDIVSGDFYWAKKVEGRIIFGVVDCTGHGVPGALMSMVGYDLIDHAVTNHKLWKPQEILDSMQHGISSILGKYQRNSGDGMAVSLCTYVPDSKKLYFSGARQPVFCIQNTEIILLRGDKQSIGGYKKHIVPPHPFTPHEIVLNEPTTLYLYSDGYQDQFGGPQKRKFMARNFRAFLKELAQKPLPQQKDLLNHKLSDWMHQGQETQMDDITVLGIKLV